MTEQGVRRSVDQVLALASDAASRRAGSRLGVAGPWSGAGCSGEGAVWGLCQGGGSTPYRTVADLGDAAGPAYRCSCPSRAFPCEHALGLLLLWAEEDGAVPRGEPPRWAARWLGDSAEGRGRRAERGVTAGAGGSSSAPADPQAARRRAERRAERITAGATELEQRLADLLRGGLAGAEQADPGLWEETAARMVDAQAPGLAARVRDLAGIASSGPGWPVRLLEECALLHLLDQGWLHRERLPRELAATVRSRVGLARTADGPPLRDRWLVLARYDVADASLTTRRTWLYGTATRHTALLLSYGAAGRAPEPALPVGLALDAEVSAHPGGQRRVALRERYGAPAPTRARPDGVTAARAAAHYGEALRADPWLDSVPVTLERAVPVRDGDRWQLADADEDAALPLTAASASRPGLWRLVALSGGAPVKVFGEFGHRGLTPLAAWPRATGEVVPLH
ncbi:MULTISPECIES: SWIM zinc finger family protein [unclassified Streptomyces]|uniref:SWIM zinc finger family protein n=1 Tax=unclassified Streptomyces TaxID=2593676 RepID=UPI001F043E4E|nr:MULTISPECIES: SWIM zinc finger family protein [unclassified Streptomyces]MCH0563959.1 SWIM zinc finger family protein [Streptomyces sp. MUM 2J]MCH0570726.1 SWIM zinc finger family protein [Streptomyces sp. MUM 136J]